MGNPISFNFSSREKNSEYGHLFLRLKLHQVSTKNAVFVESEMNPTEKNTNPRLSD